MADVIDVMFATCLVCCLFGRTRTGLIDVYEVISWGLTTQKKTPRTTSSMAIKRFAA